MTSSVSDLKKYRKRFATILAISFGLLLVTSSEVLYWQEPATLPGLVGFDWPEIVAVVSMLTSVVSLLGLLITTCIAWRKERREGRGGDLDLEKKRLELEMLRLELEKKRQENSSKASDSTDLP